jgi:hypothetical protein
MSIPAYTAYFSGVAGQAHNEAAFRHFLSIERRRADRAAHSVLLVLISMPASPERTARFGPSTAAVVFSALGQCVREADFVGWYREDRVAAAVLTHQPAPADDIRTRVTARVVSALRTQPSGADMTFRVRAFSLGGKARA